MFPDAKRSKHARIFQVRRMHLERSVILSGLLGSIAAAIGGCSDPPMPEFGEGASGSGVTGGGGGSGSGLAPNAGASGTSGGASGTSTGGSAAGGAGSGLGGALAGASGAGAIAGGGVGAVGGSGGGAPGGIGGSSAGPGGGAGVGGSGLAGSGGSTPGDRNTPEGVCARWNGDRANLSEGTWSGSVATCTVGDISADGRANALRLFNLYRWLADLPAVQTEASRDAQAQACALMMDAEGELSHDPGEDWACYTEAGAQGASSSNISGGPGVSSVDAYMIDNGNETTHGHRRIVLSNQLGPIGLGSTGPGGASCMQNLRGTGTATKTWMAWPSPGIIPLQAIRRNNNSSLDRTGWSVQSNTIDVTAATVTITAGGVNQPVTKSNLTGTYGGARYAIRIVPMGWTTMAGQTYTVSLAGTSTPISYTVQVVDCAL
jgi:hypothetical protein